MVVVNDAEILNAQRHAAAAAAERDTYLPRSEDLETTSPMLMVNTTEAVTMPLVHSEASIQEMDEHFYQLEAEILNYDEYKKNEGLEISAAVKVIIQQGLSAVAETSVGNRGATSKVRPSRRRSIIPNRQGIKEIEEKLQTILKKTRLTREDTTYIEKIRQRISSLPDKATGKIKRFLEKIEKRSLSYMQTESRVGGARSLKRNNRKNTKKNCGVKSKKSKKKDFNRFKKTFKKNKKYQRKPKVI